MPQRYVSDRTPRSHNGRADGVMVHRETKHRAILQRKLRQNKDQFCGDDPIDDLLRARTAYGSGAIILNPLCVGVSTFFQLSHPALRESNVRARIEREHVNVRCQRERLALVGSRRPPSLRCQRPDRVGDPRWIRRRHRPRPITREMKSPLKDRSRRRRGLCDDPEQPPLDNAVHRWAVSRWKGRSQSRPFPHRAGPRTVGFQRHATRMRRRQFCVTGLVATCSPQ